TENAAAPAVIGPGQTISVDAKLLQDGTSSTKVDPQNYAPYLQNSNPYKSGDPRQMFVQAASDLAPDRSRRLEELLTRDDVAIIYAECEQAPAAVALGHG